MQIFVRLPAGGELSILVDPSDDTEQLKKKISDQAQIPRGIKFAYHGAILEQGRSLDNYGIVEGAMIDVPWNCEGED
jgi:hypothetical protein